MSKSWNTLSSSDSYLGRRIKRCLMHTILELLPLESLSGIRMGSLTLEIKQSRKIFMR